jgi:queuine/archaeosine tRNA-ribosyltransferase
MQKEINETAAQGYRILVGAPTSGSEMAMFLSLEGTIRDPYQYKLLATTRTGTMQKELNETADAGYRLIPSTMIAKKQLLGGIEIVMILERPPTVKKHFEYKLLATSRTSTLQKEVTEAKEAGYIIVGMVSRGEHMVVMERETSITP